MVKRNEKASKDLEGNDKRGNINRKEARALWVFFYQPFFSSEFD